MGTARTLHYAASPQTINRADWTVLMDDSRRILRLALRNYKSVERCEIELSPLTVLVGRNGVGKSNIIDALRFTAHALSTTLEYAIRERGGIDQVRRKSLGGRPTHPGVAMRLRLANGEAEYSFRIAAVSGRGFSVDREQCDVFDADQQLVSRFKVRSGEIAEWAAASPSPAVSSDRLLLVAASGLPEFRPVFDVLTRMAFHNLNPELMKFPQRPEAGDLLAHDGHNLASVIKQLETRAPARLERVLQYLNAIGVPLTRIQHKQAGALETLEISQKQLVPEGERNSNFDALAMSDGTIRALGILVSLVSAYRESTSGPSLIGIEEPETALHPAAAGALMDALLEGSEETQLLVTCHSPDLLDHSGLSPNSIRAVLLENGRTVVGPLSEQRIALLRDHLSTAGELLRLDQLTPDPEDIRRQDEARGTLFEAIA